MSAVRSRGARGQRRTDADDCAATGQPGVNTGDADVYATAEVNGVDQRGYGRPGNGYATCSIGAYEYNSPGLPPSCVGDCNHNGAVTIERGLRSARPDLRVADLAETCVPGPLPCPSNGDAVCGCEVAYPNDCTRVSAGATLAHAGACAGGRTEKLRRAEIAPRIAGTPNNAPLLESG